MPGSRSTAGARCSSRREARSRFPVWDPRPGGDPGRIRDSARQIKNVADQIGGLSREVREHAGSLPVPNRDEFMGPAGDRVRARHEERRRSMLDSVGSIDHAADSLRHQAEQKFREADDLESRIRQWEARHRKPSR
jgi:hypothetical protein